jgi:hypothetical protein
VTAAHEAKIGFWPERTAGRRYSVRYCSKGAEALFFGTAVGSDGEISNLRTPKKERRLWLWAILCSFGDLFAALICFDVWDILGLDLLFDHFWSLSTEVKIKVAGKKVKCRAQWNHTFLSPASRDTLGKRFGLAWAIHVYNILWYYIINIIYNIYILHIVLKKVGALIPCDI